EGLAQFALGVGRVLARGAGVSLCAHGRQQAGQPAGQGLERATQAAAVRALAGIDAGHVVARGRHAAFDAGQALEAPRLGGVARGGGRGGGQGIAGGGRRGGGGHGGGGEGGGRRRRHGGAWRARHQR